MRRKERGGEGGRNEKEGERGGGFVTVRGAIVTRFSADDKCSHHHNTEMLVHCAIIIRLYIQTVFIPFHCSCL